MSLAQKIILVAFFPFFMAGIFIKLSLGRYIDRSKAEKLYGFGRPFNVVTPKDEILAENGKRRSRLGEILMLIGICGMMVSTLVGVLTK